MKSVNQGVWRRTHNKYKKTIDEEILVLRLRSMSELNNNPFGFLYKMGANIKK